MAARIDELTAQNAALVVQVDAAVANAAALKAKLDAAIANALTAEEQAALGAVIASLNQSAQKLSDSTAITNPAN